jgi:uncharacterized protein involved in exopolysaccharide biosynthesis
VAREAFVVALPEIQPGWTLADVLRLAVLRWKWLILFAAAGGLAGLAIALVSTTNYESSATLAFVSDSEKSGIADLAAQFGGLADLAGIGSVSGSPGKAETMAVLRSKELVSRFIAENKLLPILFVRKWDSAGKKWETGSRSAPTMNEAIRLFSDSVRRINIDQKAGTVTVTIRWSKPDVAARWCAQFVAAADNLLRQRAIAQSRKNIEFLNARMAATESAELRNTIARLVEAQLKTEMLATTRAEYAFDVVDPPLAQDVDHPQSPQLLTLVISGVLASFILGFVVILLFSSSKPSAAQ